MRRDALVAVLALGFFGCSSNNGTAPPTTGPAITVAFGSARPPSSAFGSDLYTWDGAAGGAPVPYPNLNTPYSEGPCCLTGDGRMLAYSSTRSLVGSISSLLLYDVPTASIRVANAFLPLIGPLNPSFSADGRYLAANYQISGDPFDQFIGMMDVAADTLLLVSNLNDPNGTNFDPWLNGDGSLLAFASNGFATVGAFDIMLYSVPGDTLIRLPGLNTASNELSPSISADGRYVAFQSGRTSGVGLIDVYVYDRQTGTLLDLPGANTVLSEYQPTISPDGRWLAYVTDATGGGDVRIYDLQNRRLLTLPGLNDPYFLDQYPVVISTPVP